MPNINGETKVYGIVGKPVCHSLSPMFQHSFLEEHQINATYVPFLVADQESVDVSLQGLWHAGVQGLNITVPYKEMAFQHSSPDEDAQRIGAVNTLYRGEGGWSSTNTDWQGIYDVIQQKQWPVEGKDVLLFGAGGTARAIVHALNLLNIKTLYITNRTAERAQQLQQHAKEQYPDLNIELVDWDDKKLQATMLSTSLLINATTQGLKEGDTFPFALVGEGYALDVVYRPSGKTAFRCSAMACGREAVDGLPMLLAQGAASFSHWHGRKPDWIRTLAWLESKLARSQIFRWKGTL
ncbi:MAG: shikimate dehydrogenase [Mariprofundaceae bacterium]|nr:shikimate dehydrogenase [Mariprofundaceae bacterium]